MVLKIFRSKKFVFTFQINEKRWKIFQAIFSNSDGGLYISFPYYKFSEGLVSVVTFPRSNTSKKQLSLEPGGKVTSHLVKYTHHPSGIAQFSQTGRVETSVRKKSIPLLDASGHLFTIQLQGIHYFKFLEPSKYDVPPKVRETILNFKFDDSDTIAYKIVGRWYSTDKLSSRMVGNNQGPKVFGQTPNGKIIPAFLISPPKGLPTSKYILMVSIEATPRLTKEDTVLTFIGGFDPPSVVNDLTCETTFLALSYPIKDYKELNRRLESIDLEN